MLKLVSLPVRLVLLTAGTFGMLAGLLAALLETAVFASLVWWAWKSGALVQVAELVSRLIG